MAETGTAKADVAAQTQHGDFLPLPHNFDREQEIESGQDGLEVAGVELGDAGGNGHGAGRRHLRAEAHRETVRNDHVDLAAAIGRYVKARLDADPLLAGVAVGGADLTDDLNLRADALVNLAESLRLADAPDQAAEALQRAVQLYEQKGNVVGAARASMIASERVR